MKVIAFMANWCGPCRRLDPLLPESVERVDVDAMPQRAMEHSIGSIPTLVLVGDNSEVISRLVGYVPKEKLDLWLRSAHAPR